ncbi:MAG: response regulator [Lachnospiraceae bacterium]|nr:response regulator [Lachnospiraceae bacterium]
MQLDYNIFFETSIFLVDVMICLYLYVKYGASGTEINKYFRRFAVVTTISTALDVISATVMSIHLASIDWLHMVLLIASQVFKYATVLYFVVYSASFIGSGYFGTKMEKFNFFINIAFVVMEVQNLFTGNAYSFVDGRLVKGPLWMVLTFGFSLYFMIFGMLFLIRYSKNYRREQAMALSIGGVIVLVLFILQMVVTPHVLLTSFAASFAVLLFLLTFETPDYSALLKAMDELKESREREKAEREKADEANHSKNKFLSQMSHEIRTPINAILGYDDLILNAEKNNREVIDYAERIKTSATGLLDFFTSVIDYVSDSDTGDMEVAPPTVSKFKEMSQTADMLKGEGVRFDRLVLKKGYPEQRILIVDDNDMNVDLLVRMLRPAGIRMDVGENGKEAIDMLRHTRYNIIFMDHMMPVMDGVEAMDIMKATHLCDGVPVIMMTAANITPQERDKYMKAGFVEYISKPFEDDKIYDIMLRFLPLEEKVDEKDVTEDIWLSIRNIFSFLDTEMVRRNFEGDEDYFLSVLSDFSTRDYPERLTAAYGKKDFYRYSCILQAVRENAELIGAKDLSTVAKTSRNLAEASDSNSLSIVHPQLMNSYQGLMARIKSSMKKVRGGTLR